MNNDTIAPAGSVRANTPTGAASATPLVTADTSPSKARQPRPIFSFFARTDPPRSHDVHPLSTVVAEPRGSAFRARHRPLPRDRAALAFMERALKRHEKAEAIVTDVLRSYPAAMRELGNLERPLNGEMVEESSGKRGPAIPPTSARDAAISKDENAPEVRFRPCLLAQPFQFRTPPELD